jgi:transposase-like protein
LAYSLYYSEYKNWFKTTKMDIALFKNQVGKDASRMNFMMNNKKFNFNNEDENSIKADKFNVELMNILSIFTVIDFNLISIIDVVMCQNILNFIMDLISLVVMKKFAPEKLLITQVEKDAIITLTNSQQNIVYNFKTKFYITKDGGIYDPEFTCGDMEFSFLIDFKKNTYKITKFKCKYNSETCYQGANLESLPANTNVSNEVVNEEAVGEDSPNYVKYGILGLGIGGIVATPYLLAALGGKNKKGKKRKRKNKTKKRKKSFYK